jgi:hypothetical protein
MRVSTPFSILSSLDGLCRPLVSLVGPPIGEVPELCCTSTLPGLTLRIDSKIDRVIDCKPAAKVRKLTVERRHSSSVINKTTLLSSRKITIEKQYTMLQPQSILLVPCLGERKIMTSGA